MQDQEMLEVQQGIWIDERGIRDAGLGTRLQVVVRPGEIRILPVPAEHVSWRTVQGLSDKNHQRDGKFSAPWGVMPNLGDCQTPL